MLNLWFIKILFRIYARGLKRDGSAMWDTFEIALSSNFRANNVSFKMSFFCTKETSNENKLWIRLPNLNNFLLSISLIQFTISWIYSGWPWSIRFRVRKQRTWLFLFLHAHCTQNFLRHAKVLNIRTNLTGQQSKLLRVVMWSSFVVATILWRKFSIANSRYCHALKDFAFMQSKAIAAWITS